MSSSWLQPPRLRVGGEGEGERHATWLELFFDLVFVATIIALAGGLTRDLSVAGVLRFVVLFVPVWWSWVGAAYFATRFDTDDAVHRLLTLLQMIAVAAMTANVHAGLESSSAGFALSYAAVRLLLVVEYLRAGRYVPEARSLTVRYSRGFGVAALIWLVSAVVPIPFRFVFWVVGFLVDFGTPVLAGRLHAELAPHPWHLPERFGLFTLIVLGEAVAGAVAGVSGHGWDAASAGAAALGLSITFGLWWLYFNIAAGRAILAARECGRVGVYQEWLYMHLPLTVGLVALGVGITKAVLGAPGPLPDAVRWLMSGSAAVCFFALSGLHLTTASPGTRPQDDLAAVALAAAGMLMLLLAAGGVPVGSVGLTGVVAAFCAVLVAIDIHEMGRRSGG